MKNMNKVAVIAIFATLAACEESTSRHQQRDTFELSKEVELTQLGKSMEGMRALPTEFVISSGEFNEANPPAKNLPCAIESQTFTASFTAPGTLNLPTYGSATPEISIVCVDGSREIKETAKSVNLTQLAYTGESVAHVVIGFGLIGAAATQAQASQRDKSKDIYGYNPQIVIN